MTVDYQRALNAPFTLPADWAPILGACSRCGGPASLAEDRWWHEGEPCRPKYGVPAEFLPAER